MLCSPFLIRHNPPPILRCCHLASAAKRAALPLPGWQRRPQAPITPLLLLHVHVQVMTIEPGVYIPASPVLNERAPGRFRGIGIRIEDEVLVTEDGHEVRVAVNVVLPAGRSPPG